jgi:1-acyl-sn-glycerol-3-phosphate acyltransferase
MAGQPQVSSYSAPHRGAFNLAWGLIGTGLSVLWTVPCAIIAAILATIGRLHGVTLISRLWARVLIRLCGIRVEIEGMENLAGLDHYILVANHQSFFDIFACTAWMPGEPRFVAKKELLKIPVIGYALDHSGHIIIDREAGGREIRKAIASIRSGMDVIVFAEGHRYNDNRVHEFQDGAAWLAILSQLPAVPMSISGSGAFFPRGAKVVVPGLTMKMRIGRPIATAGMKSADRGRLTKRLEEAVRATFTTDV